MTKRSLALAVASFASLEAAASIAFGVTELVSAPLNIPGGYGSPANVIALK
ncbi:MAG TPA: hypothetical protein VGD29_29015 [Actinoplanes sp.]|jgi:hypothetical protein